MKAAARSAGLASILSLATFAAAKGKPTWAAAAKPGDKTIVEIVLEDDGEFDILEAAVIHAGLVDALNGKGQFTVFAPTADAFLTFLGAADEAAAIEAIEALDPAVVGDILLYHVTKGRRHSRSVLAAPNYKMLNGDKLTRAELLDAGIAEPDKSASNGIIHAIDTVLSQPAA